MSVNNCLFGRLVSVYFIVLLLVDLALFTLIIVHISHYAASGAGVLTALLLDFITKIQVYVSRSDAC